MIASESFDNSEYLFGLFELVEFVLFVEAELVLERPVLLAYLPELYRKLRR